MKRTTIQKITVGVLCASLMGAASFASAAGWHNRGYRGQIVSRSYAPAFGFGLGVGVTIGAPLCEAPVYAGPSYYGGVIGPEVVIGGGYYHGSRAYARRGHWR